MTEIEAIEAELIQRELANREQQPQKQKSKLEQRTSQIADLAQNPVSMEHPLGAILRTLGGAAELYQGVPASIGLDLQAGRPQDIPGNLAKVLTGQRPAEYGDIFRGAGVPEPLSAVGGLYSDVMLSPGGAEGTIGLVKGTGKLLKGGVNALKNILKFDNALVQAEKGKSALDTIRTTLGKAKEIAMQEVKNLTVDFDWKKIPDKVLAKLRDTANGYGIEFSDDGKIINTLGNIDKVKMALQDIPSTKDFVEAGNMAKKQIINLSREVRDAMVSTANKAGKPELAKSLKDYHNFMNNYNLANDHLVDKYGNAMANKLKATFRLTAEPAVKEAWKEIGKLSPEVKGIIKSRTNRELLKALLITAPTVESGKRIITGRW